MNLGLHSAMMQEKMGTLAQRKRRPLIILIGGRCA